MNTSNGVNQQPMNTSSAPPSGGNGKVIGIIIAVLLVIGAAVWAMNSKKSGPDNSQTQTKSAGNKAPALEQVMSKNQTLKELMASGVSQKCDFTSKSADGQTQAGRVYLAGGRMRGYFDALVNGKEVKSNMMNDGQNVYVWMDGESKGYKISATTMMDKPADNPQTKQSVDANAKYDYSCIQGGVGDENFKLPDQVTFSDMSSVMMQGQAESSAAASSAASMKAKQCAACDSAGASKAQCRAALGC